MHAIRKNKTPRQGCKNKARKQFGYKLKMKEGNTKQTAMFSDDGWVGIILKNMCIKSVGITKERNDVERR